MMVKVVVGVYEVVVMGVYEEAVVVGLYEEVEVVDVYEEVVEEEKKVGSCSN